MFRITKKMRLFTIFVEEHLRSAFHQGLFVQTLFATNPFFLSFFSFSYPPTDAAVVTRGTLCTRGSRVFHLVRARPSPDPVARRCPPRVFVPRTGSYIRARSRS